MAERGGVVAVCTRSAYVDLTIEVSKSTTRYESNMR